ncbi:hypothetical protein F5884DRAFT_722339 [Xylogone sp. PMI_703]|nr:hypothetical protein F5884DRAFT_722339 [Xylogone sp. PMI_703]
MPWLLRRHSHRRPLLLLGIACASLLWWILNHPGAINLINKSRCAPLPGAEDVFVVMKTGAAVLRKKLPVHFETTFVCIPDYVVYSDLNEVFHGHKIHNILNDIDGETKARMPELSFHDLLQRQQGTLADLPAFDWWKLDKWKFLPMMTTALKARPEAKWFAFIEDDTALIWSNLLAWLSAYDPREIHYFGREERVADRPFPYGGAGFVLSNAALKKAVDWMIPRIDRYYNDTRDQLYGDITLGWLLEDAGIPLTNIPLFQGESPSKLEYTENTWCQPIITYHHVSVGELTSLWKLEQSIRRQNMAKRLVEGNVFNDLIRPHLRSHLTNWDNRASENTHFLLNQSFEDCQQLCSDDQACTQFRFWQSECQLSSKIILGASTEPQYRIDSGWMLDRIDKSTAAMQCKH